MAIWYLIVNCLNQGTLLYVKYAVDLLKVCFARSTKLVMQDEVDSEFESGSDNSDAEDAEMHLSERWLKKNLPKDLPGCYDMVLANILRTIDPNSPNDDLILRRVLPVLAVAKEPLSVDELVWVACRDAPAESASIVRSLFHQTHHPTSSPSHHLCDILNLFRLRSSTDSGADGSNPAARIYPFHQTVMDWMMHKCDQVEKLDGEILLGQACADIALNPDQDRHDVRLSEAYALKHAVGHLHQAEIHRIAANTCTAHVMGGNPLKGLASPGLFDVLQSWDFMRRVFEAKCSHVTIASLAEALENSQETSHSPEYTSYLDETLRWLSRCRHRFLQDASDMERETLCLCPPESEKYKEAGGRLAMHGPTWVTKKVLGGLSGHWPPADPERQRFEVMEIMALLKMPNDMQLI